MQSRIGPTGIGTLRIYTLLNYYTQRMSLQEEYFVSTLKGGAGCHKAVQVHYHMAYIMIIRNKLV